MTESQQHGHEAQPTVSIIQMIKNRVRHNKKKVIAFLFATFAACGPFMINFMIDYYLDIKEDNELNQNINELNQNNNKLNQNINELKDSIAQKFEPRIDGTKGQGISQTDSDIAEATRLQMLEQYDPSIDKWLYIAGNNDKKTASMAYSSAAYIMDDDKYKGKHAPIADKVINLYSKSIELHPTSSAYKNRGLAKSKMGKYKEAIADYSEAIKLSHDDPEAFYNRGRTRATLSKHEEAIADYSEAIRLGLDDVSSAYNNRGYANTELDKHEEAINDFSEAIKLDTDLVNAYIGRGVANTNLGKYDEAKADFSKALDLEPGNKLAKQAIEEIEVMGKND